MSFGVFIDGDNISSTYADEIRRIASDEGTPTIARVYGNSMAVLKGWEKHGWLRPVYSGGGKNASDIVLGLDAVDLIYSAELRAILIASSDVDFYHLATKVRELGRRVLGVGRENAPKRYREACSLFVPLSDGAKVSKIDRLVRQVVLEGSREDVGIPLKALGSKMGHAHAVSIRSMPEKTWRAYLSDRPAMYEIKPREGEDYVRVLKDGFRDEGSSE